MIKGRQILLSDFNNMNDNIDLKKYIEFRESVKKCMEHPEWLGDFSEEELVYLLNNNSKIWLYYLEDVPVCSMMLIPAREKDLEKFEKKVAEKYKDSPKYMRLKDLAVNIPILHYTASLGNKKLYDEHENSMYDIIGEDLQLDL